MAKIDNFIKWFRDLGGSIDRHHEAVCAARMQPIPEPPHSFRDRAQEVKSKYNHKFRVVKEEDFLKDYPNIDNLNFEKKC